MPALMSSRHGTHFPKGAVMEYEERLKRLDEHIAKHPNDYQAVIAKLKTYSDSVEHKQYLRKVERIKKIAKYKEIYG